MSEKITTWINERIPFDWGSLKHALDEPIPRHMHKWWFCLGGTPLYLFMIQMLSGIALTFYFVPDPDKAYESVRYITQEAPFGWWVRGVHRWSGELMVVAVILHMIRVFFTNAYRKPRELNWLIGMLLLVTIFTFGFSGYSLIYNQLSYWAMVVGTNITASIPVVGEFAAGFLRGGPVISANTLTRMYVLHVGLLPMAAVALIALHLFLLRLHGVSDAEDTGEGDSDEGSGRFFPFFPDHLMTELAIGVFLIYLISQLAIIFPVHLGEPANPAVTPEHIKPEWYFYPVFRFLKLFSFKTGIISLLVIVTTMFAWPWVDAAIERRFPGKDISIYVGIAASLMIIMLILIEGLSGQVAFVSSIIGVAVLIVSAMFILKGLLRK
ncbi:MAG: cytochrome bc complex cytochrome b subunit [Nitrospinaceae bacterium]|nr:cytochrome bc complex cytochrome b subunit [Nitrospinaceae bacterium]MBT3821420.1 cytochrome bc complex cytochrome b subunit [Nitrospinaceae bacterium]MBT4095247.1 cytochrome bc complex cytochrome b subunit [Nitrospinaceae bacterium]MBT4432531.1 cytochrome bc complex cytochrome b subunit [Nitrospinaceae bacterium]MBT5368621.1 cytochrome bc complex cytochrome b subunit [Nitrospinaceae bacterium]